MKKRYRVVFTERAKRDFERSYQWGRREWGDAAARRWYREIKAQILFFPLSRWCTRRLLKVKSMEARSGK